MTRVIETIDAFEIGTAGLIVASVRRVGVALVLKIHISLDWRLPSAATPAARRSFRPSTPIP